jgi:hypothetical protein
MSHSVANIQLALFIALLSAGPVSTQTSSIEATPEAAAAASVAHVYVQTTKGVNLYDAAANGKLTLVNGSPFQTVGEMIGSNGKYFITLGTNLVRTYAIEPDGAIGKQVSEIDTRNYNGGECGKEEGGFDIGTRGAVLDHTGQNLYVVLDSEGNGAGDECAAYQTFSISKVGELAYDNAAILYDNNALRSTLPTITANEKFAYAANADDGCNIWLTTFSRGSDGSLKYANLNESIVTPAIVVADPTNHLAMEVETTSNGCILNPPQLQSFSVDAEGHVSSTNTAEDMPHPRIYPTTMNMSPSGKLLAVGGWVDFNDLTTAGLEVFRFNGAEPITPYGSVLTRNRIYQIHWDNNNHLYGLGSSELYVYTITPTSITQVPGSPFSMNLTNTTCNEYYSVWWSCPNALVVVPK